MPQRVLDAKVDFYSPATGLLRYSLTSNLRRVSINEGAVDESDDASIELAHDFADLSNFVVGDECRVFIQVAGGTLDHIWTGVLDRVASQRDGPAYSEAPLSARDYVFWTLAHSYITDSFSDMAAGAIVRAIVQAAAPDLDVTAVEDTDVTVPLIAFNGESLLSAIRRLADLAGATFKGDKDKGLHFYEKGTQSSGESATPANVVRGTFAIETNAEGFGNVVTVRGGKRKVQDAESLTGAFDSFAAVTGIVRRKARIFFSKSHVARVDLWTNPDAPSALLGGLTVRIQADNEDGTAPTAEADSTFDLVSATLTADQLSVGDWTAFDFSEHIVAAGNHCWIIVESDEESQRVGLDSSGNLLWRSYFGMPIVVQKSDAVSIATYGRRELRPITNKDIGSEDEAEQFASRALAEHKDPVLSGSYEVYDLTTLGQAEVGETVSATFEADGVAADTELLLTQKEHIYDADEGTYTQRQSFVSAHRLKGLEAILSQFNDRIKRLEDAAAATPVLFLVTSVSDLWRISDSVDAVETSAASSVFIVGTSKVGFFTIG